MSVREIVDTFQAWLPIPEYRFEGGPLDGQVRIVELIKTEYGMIAPKIWAYDEFPPVEPLPILSEPAPVDVVVKRHFYLFEPTRSPNEGRYVYAAGAQR